MTVNNHLTTPCPVCGLVEECPHTPVRCNHFWLLEDGKPMRRTDAVAIGETRTCEYCGRVERATLAWHTVVA